MTRHSTALALALVLALALTGCIQNMGALKEKVDGDDAGEGLAPASAGNATSTAANATTGAAEAAKKPPVARTSLYAPNGALVYKSSFQAEDPAEVVFVEEKSSITANAGDSETLERGATLTGFAWTLDGKALPAGRQATVEVGEAGIYVLLLTVTDSNGMTDTQTLKLGVPPKPYEVATEVLTGPVAGVEGAGQGGSATFELALDTSQGPATIQSVSFAASPPTSCVDMAIQVLDAEGEAIGEASGSDAVEAGALPLGTYTIEVIPYACVAQDGIPITVVVTYVPVIEALGETEGHGPHAGH